MLSQILDPQAPPPSFYSGLATETDHKVPQTEGAEGAEGADGEPRREPDDFSTAFARSALRTLCRTVVVG